MKVEYTLLVRGNQHESSQEGIEQRVTFCCDSMKGCWITDGFGIGFCSRTRTVDFDGGEWDCEINFCPFCAERIEVVQVAVKDKRIKTCCRERTLRNWSWEPAMCSEPTLPDSDYCACHAGEQAEEVLREA